MRTHSISIAAALAAWCLSLNPSQALAHEGDSGHEEVELTPRARQQLAALRAATAPYHDFDAATAVDRWDTPITLCMSSAEGGMGYHYADVGNFGVHDPARPQALIFEPEEDGSMRLVAVEYIVLDGGTPGIKDSPPPPPMFGQAYEYVPAFDVWGLHAWVWRNNPAGMFAAWNPNVSCEFGVPQP